MTREEFSEWRSNRLTEEVFKHLQNVTCVNVAMSAMSHRNPEFANGFFEAVNMMANEEILSDEVCDE